MLFTREQLEGVYYLIIGVLLLAIIPLFIGGQGVDSVCFNQDDSLFMPTPYKRTSLVTVRKVENKSVIDLNRADSSKLVSLKGIGPFYAEKILEYRSKLGGFFDIRQLRELNMSYFNFDSMAFRLRADTTLIVKRDMTNMEFKALLRHPYLDYETVTLIFDYKRCHKTDTITIEKLSAAGILRSTQAIKLSHYFY